MLDVVVRLFSPASADGAAYGARDQEDAQEFLTFLLDGAHSEILKLRALYGLSPDAPSAAPHAPSSAPAAADGDGWERVGRNNRSAVTREVAVGRGPPTAVSGLFAGQLCSTVRADNMKPSATVQPFVVLQLDIAGADVRTVPDALAGMARAEEVQGYRAEGSKHASVAHKTTRLQQLPPVLVLHLMRFAYADDGTISKISRPIAFTRELRVKSAWISATAPESRSGATYNLVSCVTHHGKSPQGGHYTADVRQPSGEWLRFDDERVGAVREADVLGQEAYLLFYVRADGA